jgi:hypothetical protein
MVNYRTSVNVGLLSVDVFLYTRRLISFLFTSLLLIVVLLTDMYY